MRNRFALTLHARIRFYLLTKKKGKKERKKKRGEDADFIFFLFG
jgi:hypothetical protein